MVSASDFVSADKDLLSVPVNAFLPRLATVPLCEDAPSLSEVLVEEGTRVREGDVIAKSREIFIHSPVPGIVRRIGRCQYSNGRQGPCAEIALDGAFTFLGRPSVTKSWQAYEASTVRFLLMEAGVVNTFARAVPVFGQLKGRAGLDSILVLRLFDCDPSLVTESFVAWKFLRQVLEGAGILARAFMARNLVIAYSGNERESLRAGLDSLIAEERPHLFMPATEILTVAVDTKRYPAGTMHDIAAAVKRTYKSDVFSKLGKKDLFVDSTTALNAYNAVVLGKPVVSSLVHVTGDCLNAAAMLNVRIGTPLRSVAEQCGGFKRSLSKIIINGIISGRAVSSLDIPVGRAVKSVEFVPGGKPAFPQTKSCVRCGSCRKICPVCLWPGNLYRIAGLDDIGKASVADKDAYKSSLLCTDCGLCNSVCPSRIPLCQTISLLKDSYHEI